MVGALARCGPDVVAGDGGVRKTRRCRLARGGWSGPDGRSV